MAAALVQQDPWQYIQAALRKPEAFVLRWRDSKRDPAMFAVLTASSMGCLAAYGLTMGLPLGLRSMGWLALLVPLSAALAWCLSFPALYVINTAMGSPLDRSTTALAALTALHFGALARLASAPLSWFFGVTIHYGWALTALHVVVFSVTALCMLDVFLRIMKALNPKADLVFPFFWLCLVALIDVELKLIFNFNHFAF